MSDLKTIFDSCEWAMKLGFDLHGTRVGIRVETFRDEEYFRKAIPASTHPIPFEESVYRVTIAERVGGVTPGLYLDFRDFERVYTFISLDDDALLGLETKLQFVCALVSAPERYFLHAGAVGIGGLGVVIVGGTRSGKTTLVRKLVEAGARYYTDDCAIISVTGMLYPNTAPLAVRSGDDRLRLSARSIGGRDAVAPVPVRTILFPEYKPGADWQPSRLERGAAAFRILNSLFYRGAVNEDPSGAMKFASSLAGQAESYFGERGECDQVSEWLVGVRGAENIR